MSPSSYKGRFAPSPSGPLHLGSLACALASYFDAKANAGLWLVRMEDIDPPREPAGAAKSIVECLQAHQLYWDGDITYQSQRSQAYTHALQQLEKNRLTYLCQCTRKRLRTLEGNYDGHCRTLQHTEGALRLNILAGQQLGHKVNVAFHDRICGSQHQNLLASGDFVVHRKDGLFAYQLAVIVDDIAQGINHIVRGSDLLDVTFNQLLLFDIFDYSAPKFCHIPVLLDERGYKLSKQHGAPGVNLQTPKENILQALLHMGFEPPKHLSIQQLLTWGTEQWQQAHPLQK